LSAQEQPLEPIELQRITVPQTKLGELGIEAVPVERDVFGQQVAELNARYRDQQSPVGTRVVQASYAASFQNDQLIAGTAELQIKHARQEPAVASLTPFGVAAQAFRWLGESPSRAQVGLNQAGQHVVLVTQSGILVFDWSLRGVQDDSGRVTFELAFPPAAASQLRIELPAEWKLQCDRGLIAQSAESESEPDSAGRDSARTLWAVDLGSQTQARLECIPVAAAAAPRSLAMSAQEDRYRVTSLGLELRSQVNLDIHHAALERLQIEADAGLQMVSAYLGSEAVPLTREHSQEELAAERYVIELPRPLVGQGRHVTVSAYAPLTAGQAWRLPTVRWRGLLQQQHNATLDVVEPLQLRRLVVPDGSLNRLEPLPAPLIGESRQFTWRGPDPRIEVVLDRDPPRTVARAATTVSVSETVISAQFAAQLSATGGDVFTVRLQRDPNWIVDSIETLPADNLLEVVAPRARGLDRELRLRRPLSSTPTKIVVKAHRGTPEALSGSELRPVRLEEVDLKQHLVAVGVEAPLQMAVSHDAGLTRVQTPSLSTTDRELLGSADADLLYMDGVAADGARIMFRRAPPDFDGQISISALAEDETLKLSYILRCEPVSPRLSQVRVHFSEPPPATMLWNVVGEAPTALSARPVPEDQSEWEITLRRPRSVPFEIHATTSVSLSNPVSIPLLSLPEAVSQTGTLQIAASEGPDISLEHHGLKSIPAPQPALGQLSSTRGMFQFVPGQAAFLRVSRQLDRRESPRAWIWSADLVSQLDVGGNSTHSLLLKIENSGARSLTIQLPPQAEVQKLVVQGEVVSVSDAEPGLAVPLPRGERFPYVNVAYTLPHVQLGHWASCTPALPRLSLPCLNWRWLAWLPPGYAATPLDRDVLSNGREDDLTWDERLFGYQLLRRSGRPSNLFTREFWQEPWAKLAQRDQPQELAEKFEERMLTALSPAVDARETLTWGGLIDRYCSGPGEVDSRVELWIDEAALREVGVRTDSRVVTDPDSRPSLSAALREARLMALVVADRIVWTSYAAQARGLYGSCSFLPERVVVARPSEEVLELLVPADRWAGRPSLPSDPWHSYASASPPEPLAGWSLLVSTLDANQPPVLTVYRTATAAGLAWASFLLAIAAGLWIGQRRGLWLMALAAAAAAVALLTPSEVVPFARAVFLGLLSSLVLCWCQRKPARKIRRAEDSLSIVLASRELAAVGGCLALLLLLVATEQTLSQESVPLAQPSAKPPYLLYDPVDKDNQAAGPYVYVPRRLFEALGRLESQLSAQQTGWLVEGAHYALDLQARDVTDNVRIGQLVAEFHISTFAHDKVYVELPLRAGEVQLLDATLNGKRVYPQWSDDGNRLGVSIETPELHRLRLTLRPTISMREGRQGFDIQVPAVPESELTVNAPPFVSVEPLSAAGAVSRHEGTAQLTAELGARDRLAVDWAIAMPVQESRLEFSAAQFARLQPGWQSSTLHVRWNLVVRRGELSRVVFQVDPRWQLLPFASGQPVRRFVLRETNASSLAATDQEIQVALDRTYETSEEVTLQASFVIANRELAGVRLPALLNSVEPVKPWLAISELSGVKPELPRGSDWLEVKPAAFAAAWGTADLPAQSFQLPDPAATWSVELTTLHPPLLADEEQYLRIGRGQAEFAYYARIEASEGPLWQLRLASPRGLTYQSVTLIQNDVDLVRRWADDGAGTTTIFLNSPLAGNAQLSVSGAMRVPLRSELKLEFMRLVDATGGTSKLQVYRQPEVLLTIQEPDDRREMFGAGPLGNRTVASWEGDGLSAPRTLSLGIEPNPARFSGKLVSKLVFEAPQWFVETDLTIGVEAGVVDAIRLRLPAGLAKSMEVTPATPLEVKETTGQPHAELLLHPLQAITDTFSVRLRAALPGSRAGGTLAPDLEILDSPQVERFLVLPKRAADQPLAWDLQGMDEPTEDDHQTTYRVRGARTRASLREVKQVDALPRVFLADIHMSCNRNGSYSGVANFDLHPGALAECEIEVPDEMRLVDINVAGLTALARPVGRHLYAVRLGPEDLPQRLAVVFTGTASRLPGGHARLHFPAPSLRGLAIDQTLGTVWIPTQSDAMTPLLPHTRSDPSSLQAARVESLQQILANVQDRAAQHREEDLVAWRADWQRRLQLAQARLADLQEEEGPDSTASAPVSIDAADHLAASGTGAFLYSQQNGPAGGFSVVVHEPDTRQLLRPLITVLGLIGLFGVAFTVRRSPSIRGWVTRWPHLAGVLVGLLWWLWLSPSFLGWLIVAICLAGAVRPLWCGRPVRQSR